MRPVWFALGLLSLALGIIGVILPLMPTTVFVLMAAFCFARSSERMHAWLLAHPFFGSLILDWNTYGRIRPKAKLMASVMITLAFVLSLLLGVKLWVLAIQAVVLSSVLLFIWTRPS